MLCCHCETQTCRTYWQYRECTPWAFCCKYEQRGGFSLHATSCPCFGASHCCALTTAPPCSPASNVYLFPTPVLCLQVPKSRRSFLQLWHFNTTDSLTFHTSGSHKQQTVGSQFLVRYELTFKEKTHQSNDCNAIDLLGMEPGRCLTFYIVIYGTGRSWAVFFPQEMYLFLRAKYFLCHGTQNSFHSLTHSL